MTTTRVAFHEERLTCLCGLEIKKLHAEQTFYPPFCQKHTCFWGKTLIFVHGIQWKIWPDKKWDEEEEIKWICCNSGSKENITSAPFYSRRVTCGGLCKDCSLGCPGGLQHCTHAPKQNLQDHKAANSISGHLRPRGQCLWPGTPALRGHYHAGGGARPRASTGNQNSPVKAKVFLFKYQRNRRKTCAWAAQETQKFKTSVKVDRGHVREQSMVSYVSTGVMDEGKRRQPHQQLTEFQTRPCSRLSGHVFKKLQVSCFVRWG